MRKTPDEIREMSNSDFVAFQELWFSEPYGTLRDDVRFAQLCAVVANSSGNIKRAVSLEDFLLDFRPKEPTPIEHVIAWFTAVGKPKPKTT